MGSQQRPCAFALLLAFGLLGCRAESRDTNNEKPAPITAARKEAEADLSPENEVARLKSELALLDKDLKTLVNLLAKERVEVNQLKEKVDDLATKLSKDKELFEARRRAVEKAEDQVTLNGRSISVAAARVELNEEQKRLSTAQKVLSAHEPLLANRIRARDTRENQLNIMKNQKAELTAAVSALEVELTLLKSQQRDGKKPDETQLAVVKKDLANLKERLETKRAERKHLLTTPIPERDTQGADPKGKGDSKSEGFKPIPPAAP